jgi:hypothetical protein
MPFLAGLAAADKENKQIPTPMSNAPGVRVWRALTEYSDGVVIFWDKDSGEWREEGSDATCSKIAGSTAF